MKETFLLFALLFIGCDKNNSPTSSSYVDDEYHRQLILKKNKMGQDFLFEIKENGIDQHYVKYLGDIITTKKDTFKIVTSAHYTGIYEDAKRGNGKLYIYTLIIL